MNNSSQLPPANGAAVLESFLARAPLSVIGAQALEQCEMHEGAIDLVVSDIVMPTMGGREIAERMRAMRPYTQLLFVSGFADDEVLRQGSVITESAYLQKPFSPASVVTKIGEMLRESHGDAAQAAL